MSEPTNDFAESVERAMRAGGGAPPATAGSKRNWTLVYVLALILSGIGAMAYFASRTAVGGQDVTYEAWLTAMLSMLTILLGFIAIMLAVAALWGYEKIKETARTSAAEVGTKVAREHAEGCHSDMANRLNQLEKDLEVLRLSQSAPMIGEEGGGQNNGSAVEYPTAEAANAK